MLLVLVVHVATGIAAAARSPRVGWARALWSERPPGLRVAAGGQDGARIADGEPWRLATSIFVHADALHVFANVLALLALGRLLEPRVGTRRWLAWFVAGALGGSAVTHAAGSGANGASGGVFALLGAGIVHGLRERGTLQGRERALLGPALWAALAVGLVSPWVLPAIDPYAHLGGLAAGVVAGLAPDRGAARWVEGAVILSFAALCLYGWTR